MIGRVRHLHEERLFDCYVAERCGEPLDPRLAEHLADCADCGLRYADLADFMDGLREDGEREADAVFTPDRLRAQQHEIARRISVVGRHARVISFPGHFVRRTLSSSTTRTAPRWIAAAAAAGIFVGVALSASFQSRQSAGRQPAATRTTASRIAVSAVRADRQPDVVMDEAFLSDLEAALERPRTRELVAFDAFTPHVREVRDVR